MPDKLIKDRFACCRAAKRAAFVAYITAGDPDYERSLEIADELVAAGVDMLELGVPFSDPLADGEANQLAAARAIKSGINSRKVLELACEIRRKHPILPLILFTYLNPVAYAGDFAGFCRDAVASGINAILPLDLPPEESDCHYGDGKSYREIITDSGLPIVSLVAPTTPESRFPQLLEMAGAFIYYVSREGVTGEAKDFSADFAERIVALRRYTNLPIVVGFGISTPEHVRAAAASGVDGVVVGSAIVRKVEALAAGKGTVKDVGDFVRSLTVSS